MSNVRVVTGAHAIETLCNRFADWNDNEKARYFEDEFGHKIEWSNDPRAVLSKVSGAAVEEQFVAMVEGNIGILSEFETIYQQASDSPDGIETSNEEIIDDVSFDDLVKTYMCRLEMAQAKFPGTQFYVGYGDATFLGKITLMAFTPFEWGDREIPDAQSVTGSYLDNLYEEILQAA